MKKITILTIAALFFAGTIFAQFSMGLGLGAAANKQYSSPSALLDLEYGIKRVKFGAGFTTFVSRSTEGGALFYARVGVEAAVTEKLSAMPSIGYGIQYRSADKTELNRKSALYGLELGWQSNLPVVRIIASGMSTGKDYYFNAGVRILVVHDGSRFCR